MTSLDKFLQFRKNCPFCKCELKLITRDGPKTILNHKILNYQGDTRIVIEKSISGWKLSKYNYSFSISINLDPLRDKFFVDFLETDGSPKSKIAISDLEKYIGYFENKKDTISFERRCEGCRNYKHNSNSFFFNFHTAKLNPIIITDETFFIEDGEKVYCIEQDYLEKETNIFIYDDANYIGQLWDVDPDVWNFHIKKYKELKIPFYDFNVSKMYDELQTILMLS
jgi:hypothetical protein